MFSPNPKNDPLLSAIKGVIAENDKHREAVDRANKHFKVTDKRQLPHNLHADYDKMLSESTIISEKITKSTPMGDAIRDFEKSDAPQFEGKSKEKRRQMAIAAKMAMNEALKGNQHKIDANKNNRIDAEDFKMLRNMDEDVVLEAITNILSQDTLSEAEYNVVMESPFGDAFKAARKAGEAEFPFNGKMYNSRQADETEDQWKSNLAKSAPVPLPRPADRGRMNETGYTVAKGDTLSDIAKRNNTTVDAIAKASGISDPNKLSVGQKIVIPGQTQTATPPVPMPRRDDRMTTTMQPVASQTPNNSAIVPTRSLTPAQIGQEADRGRMTGYREIQQSGPSSGPVSRPTMQPNVSGTSGVKTGVNARLAPNTQSAALQRLDKAADRLAQGVTGVVPTPTPDTVPTPTSVAPAIKMATGNKSTLFPNRPETTVNQIVTDVARSQKPETAAGLQNWMNTQNAVKADQDQQLADRLSQADQENRNQPKTTVDQYVKSLPSPDLNTSAGLQNWLNTRR